MIRLTEILNEAENPCWDGYKQLGMKKKGGREVPNCVPESVQSVNERYRPNLDSKGYEAAQKVIRKLQSSVFRKLDDDELLEFRKAIADAFNLDGVLKENTEDLTSSERLELYKLYSKAMKAMPQSPNQKKIIKQINVLRTKAGMKPLKEVTLNEIGIFNIQSYTKGILPAGYMDTTTPQKKEKYRSTVRDLMQTLNSFWKRNNIPFRVRK